MGFKCGLVGLPNAGKSTIFNALSAAGAKVESYPFCTIEANVGTVDVPDERLNRLAELFPDKKKVPTKLEFVDIAGLVKGASEGEGMGNQFLAEIRSVDALLHVVRCFSDNNVAHVSGRLDPKQDIEVVEAELLLKDYETFSKVSKRLQSEAKGKGKKSGDGLLGEWEELVEAVASGVPVREVDATKHLDDLLSETSPLTSKPTLYVQNVGSQGENDYSDIVANIASQRGTIAIPVRGRLEAEILEITTDDDERQEYLQEYGLEMTGLQQLIRAGYELLDLVTFFTFDGPEVRAWTIRKGTTAPQAGGKVHSDFEDRFVSAEVMNLDELVELGSEKAVAEKGDVHRAGHDYAVEDGDVIHFVCG